MYDVEYINPLDNPGVLYAVIADTPEQAALEAPYRLAVNTHWLPEQFTVVSVKISIYYNQMEEKNELC